MQESRKDEILRTAARLFKEKGYSAVTMRDIAYAMQIKAASLYNHITSKQEILKIIILTLAEEFTAEMNVIVQTQHSSIQKIEKLIRLHVRISTHKQDGMACLNADWMHLEDSSPYYQSLRVAYEDNFRNIIKKGITNGEIVDENPDVILFSILSTLRSLYVWLPSKENNSEEELSDKLIRVLLKGVMLA